MQIPRNSPDEVAARGEEIFNRRIARQLSREDEGKFIVVDVDSGGFEVDADDMAAIRRASEAHPGGTFHVMRVGSRTVGRIGLRTGE